MSGIPAGGKTLAVAVDLQDEYNTVQFKLLMEVLGQYCVSLTLIRWLEGALKERKAVMQLGNWISTPKQLTMGPPQGSLISPALYSPLANLLKKWFKPGAYTCG